MWNGLKAGASGVLGFVKGIFNGVIGALESGINSAISGVNSAIKLFNRLPGPDVGTIGNVSLPRLAQGGLITSPTLAMVGEAGPEAVIPLSRPARAAQVMRQAGLGGSSNSFVINNYGSQLDESALAAKIGWQLQARGVA
jgi:SLT domain-containing protein